MHANIYITERDKGEFSCSEIYMCLGFRIHLPPVENSVTLTVGTFDQLKQLRDVLTLAIANKEAGQEAKRRETVSNEG